MCVNNVKTSCICIVGLVFPCFMLNNLYIFAMFEYIAVNSND